MKFLIALFCLVHISVYAQEFGQVYTTSFDGGYEVFADNEEPCPISIELNMTLQNMSSSEGNNKIFVVPAYSSGYKLTTLNIINRKKSSYYEVNTMASHGDAYQSHHDHHHVYALPYETGKNHLIMQGYNGRFSHKGTYALDFDIPKGGKVLASRDGVVITVVDHNTKSCGHRSCNGFNNYVRVYHDDGTFAEYTHLDTHSATVRKGDRIKSGQHIGNCGAIGWASGPHLHFEVYWLDKNKKRTIPTLFATQSHPEGIRLESKSRYTK